MTLRYHPLALAVVAALGSPAGAQQAMEADVPVEEDIVLPRIDVRGHSLAGTATGPVEGAVATESATAGKTAVRLIETAASVSVISAADLEARGGVTNLGQAVAYTPGVWLDPTFNVTNDSGFNIRGFSSWGANYLDGLKLGTGLTRAGQQSVEPFGMERVEVLRGPASVLYGQVTPGGLINTVSKRPTFDDQREVVLRFGSHDMVQGAFDINGVVGDGSALAWRLVTVGQASGTQMDDVDDNRLYIAPSLTWNIDADTTLTLLAYWRRLDGQEWSNEVPREALETVPVSFNPGEPGIDLRDSDQVSIGYEFAHEFNESLELVQNARIFRMRGNYHQVFAWNGLTGNQDRPFEVARESYRQDLTNKVLAVDTRLKWQVETGPLEQTLLFGVDYSNLDSKMDYQFGQAAPLDFADPVRGLPIGPFDDLSFDNEWKRELGVYAQDSIAYGPWRATIAGRWSEATTGEDATNTTWNYEQKDRAFVVNAGLLYLTEAGFAPYASFAQSFQPEIGSDWQGQRFEPTEAEQVEVGLKYQPPGMDALLTAAVFQITQANLTTTDPDHPNFSRQTGEVRVRGLELEGRAGLGPVDVSLAYTHLDSEITRSEDGNTGNAYANAPPNVASLWVDYRPEDGRLAGLRLGGGLRYNDASWGDEANTMRNDGALLVDLAAGFDFGALRPDWAGVSLDLNATNLNAGKAMQCTAWGCYYAEQASASATLTWRF